MPSPKTAKKQDDKFWSEFDKLLIPEVPCREDGWVSQKEIFTRYGIKADKGGSGFKKLSKLLEKRKFQDSDGKWRNYYRTKT